MVIHGDCDPLVEPEGGRATAEAIAGAELDMIEGLGHDLPVELYDRFAERIAGLVERAETGVPTRRGEPRTSRRARRRRAGRRRWRARAGAGGPQTGTGTESEAIASI